MNEACFDLLCQSYFWHILEYKKCISGTVVKHAFTFNPSPRAAEAGGSLSSTGPVWATEQFQESQEN